jgi:hypothetical protein
VLHQAADLIARQLVGVEIAHPSSLSFSLHDLAVSPELRPYQIKEGCFFIGGKSDATDTANPPIGLEIVWKQTNFANVRIHAYPPIP